MPDKFKVGDMVWVVVETDKGFQVQHLPIVGTRVNSRGRIWLYFVGDLNSQGYEDDRVHIYQEDAIDEIVREALGQIREG